MTPNVIGCSMSSTHIPVSEQDENRHKKMKYTINVQTICDCNGRFTDFDIN